MKILHVAEIHARVNGITEVVFRLSSEQQRLGHKVRIFTIANDEDVRNTEILLKMKGTSYFYQEVKNWKPDIVIFHTLYKWCYLAYALVLSKLNIPYLIEAHGAMSYANQRKNALKKRIANLLFYNCLVKNAAAVIYLCEDEKKNSVFRSLAKGVIVPNGVDIPSTCRLRDVTRDSLITIMYLGRFDMHHKGLDVLSEAIARCYHNCLEKRFRIVFYGYGMGKAKLQEALDPYRDIAEVCEPVYGVEKSEAYRNGNIFILTSRYEGLPIAILEALSFGLPCIVTPHTNMATVIRQEHAGWVTDLNPVDIAQSLVRAVDDYRSRAEELQLSARKAVQNYTWRNIAQLSLATYQSILNKY